MKSNKEIFAVLAIVVFLSGCAGHKQLSSAALKDPAQAVSFPHPVEAEKRNVKHITSFTVFMDPALWSEMDPSSSGIFPVVGYSEEDKIPGYCVYSGLTYWGDYTLRCSVEKSMAELDGVKFIIFSRDSGYAFSLAGIETSFLIKNDKDLAYDVARFDKDPNYISKFYASFGLTLAELNSLWERYISSHGKNFSDYQIIEEIELGSKDWEEYKRKTAISFPNVFEMPNGELRCSKLELDQFREYAVEIPGFNGSQRMLKRATLPVISVASGGFGWVPIVAVSLAGDAIAANIDDGWSGFYARAGTFRYSMAHVFRRISADYKELIRIRDQKIDLLEGAK
jgi:hypothetical protein